MELIQKTNVPALSVVPGPPGADHEPNFPADVARHLLEPLMNLIELGKATEPRLSVVPALIKEIEAHPERLDRTQIGIRKFFLKKIADEEASGGGAIGPTTKELAKLGAHLASLVATLRTNLPVTASRLDGDEQLMTVTLIRNLLGEYQRCFEATERSLGLEFGREYLDSLTSAVNERSLGRNSRLLVAGPLGEQISDDEYGSTNRTIIEAFAAAIVEAMVVAGVPKNEEPSGCCEIRRRGAHEGRV